MIIISGPSTIGKNPLINRICADYGYEYVTPYTTREKRREEEEGRDYVFLSKSSFKDRIRDGYISEWDYALENYYGYSFDFPGKRNSITHGLSRMTIRIKKKYPSDILTIFLMPQDIDRIYVNLKKIYRGRILRLRKELVKEEIEHANMFDYILPVRNMSEDLLREGLINEILTNHIV